MSARLRMAALALLDEHPDLCEDGLRGAEGGQHIAPDDFHRSRARLVRSLSRQVEDAALFLVHWRGRRGDAHKLAHEARALLGRRVTAGALMLVTWSAGGAVTRDPRTTQITLSFGKTAGGSLHPKLQSS